MGLFDKLNNQLEINEIKERLYEEDELKRIENRLIFEGYDINKYLLETEDAPKKDKKKSNNGWNTYSLSRIDNPWSHRMSSYEREEDKKDRAMTREEDKKDREASRRREDEDRAEAKRKEAIEKLQEEYDEELDYIKTKTIRILRQYSEDREGIMSLSETKPDGSPDPEKRQKKRDDLEELKKTYKSLMRKQKNQYEDLNSDRKYKDVRKQKIRSEYFDLDTSMI